MLIFQFVAVPQISLAQQQVRPTATTSSGNHAVEADAAPVSPRQSDSFLRVERLPVAGGVAELMTVWGRARATVDDQSEIPMVSVLRDTMGDAIPENDQLRYVWMHTYATPSAFQRAAATVPFLYRSVGGKAGASPKNVTPLIDLANADRDVWHRVFVSTMLRLLTEQYFIRAAAMTYRRNAQDYRRANIVEALAMLSLYENCTGAQPAFTPAELREIQARLMLADKSFGGLVNDVNLQNYYRKQTASVRDVRGHNWELLRQRAEAENLYFEPLELPDGSATHALLWVAREDLARNKGRGFDRRFLNIRNPWSDGRLTDWKGYVETKHFDEENRLANGDSAPQGGRSVEMIPLAIYGLDHPKIPALLVDFRDGQNPKRREMTRRVVDDMVNYVFSVSAFGDVYYMLGRTVYNFVTGRRGMDINQPSRFRSYAQMKLLLNLSASLDPQLRDEIGARLEQVSLNPMQRNFSAQRSLALAQYKALVDDALRPDGLAARLQQDRGAEMARYSQGRAEQILTRLANVASFGIYRRRDAVTESNLEQLSLRRQLNYHARFLREVSRFSPLIEVDWRIEDVRRSLQFVAAHATKSDDQTAKLAARVFARTADRQTRELCLASLKSIDNQVARKELRRISGDEKVDREWRTISAEHLQTVDGPATAPPPLPPSSSPSSPSSERPTSAVEAKTLSRAVGQ